MWILFRKLGYSLLVHYTSNINKTTSHEAGWLKVDIKSETSVAKGTYHKKWFAVKKPGNFLENQLKSWLPPENAGFYT